ncbi:MAG: hypothetical protein QOE96_4262 [Blastocatellia bacterium]|nr:hypothetical protein [Blastocatellia bacterium]
MVLIFSTATFRDLVEIVGVRSIYIFGGSKDEHRIWLHRSQKIHRALDVCAKAKLSIGRVLAQVGSEVDHDFKVSGPGRVERAEHVEP